MYQRWLNAFHAVARSGGFTAAAKLLNIGQPTVSMHVSALEAQFGVELFYRRGRRVELTALGRELLTITEGLFGREEEAIELLRAAQARETGSLRIGAVRPLDAMEICARVLKQYPNLRLAVRLMSAPDVLNGLLNFDFDAGVIGDPTDDPRFFSAFYKRYRINIIVACRSSDGATPHHPHQGPRGSTRHSAHRRRFRSRAERSGRENPADPRNHRAWKAWSRRSCRASGSAPSRIQASPASRAIRT